MKRRLSAVEARKHFGEVLEGVYYRGDEVVIERAGKPMAVVIPAERYARLERRHESFLDVLEEMQAQNKDLTTDEVAEIEREIDDAVKAVRAEMRAEREQQSPSA